MPDKTAQPNESANLVSEDRTGGVERYAVLNVFGLQIEVSNPRLAELLTMDARDALVTDVRELVTGAVPDVVLSPPTLRDEADERLRREFKSRVEAAGSCIGFDASRAGIWRSSLGPSILTRTIERPVSLAAASHYVSEIAARREAIAGPDATVLFVVDSQQTADVFKVAIRQRRLYDLMRTISIDNLEDVRDLVREGAISHQQAVVLLVPITNIDVGEVLSIIHAKRAVAE